MDLSRPLTAIAPTIDADVLAVLASVDTVLSGRQVHRVIGRHSQSGVNRVLNRLVGEGIVERTTVGSAHGYTLNRDHLQAGAVIELVRARERLVERLGDELASWTDPPHFAALYGSSASGEHTSGSDIDLVVVRPDTVTGDDPAWGEALVVLRTAVGRWTGNPCDIVEYSTDEIDQAFAHGDPFITSIGRQMIVLVGPGSFLRRPVRRQEKAARA